MQTQPCILDQSAGGCDRYAVEQGPQWLAEVLYNPPGWVWPAIFGIVLLAIAGGLWGYRRFGIDADAKVDILFNGSVILFVGGAIELLKRTAEFDYLTNILLAVAVGFGAAVLMKRYCYRPLMAAKASGDL